MTEEKRKKHLRVPVLEMEKSEIEQSARCAGLSVAAYLRKLGLGYEVRGILDYERVDDLAKISADLGRLGGLLKMWLSNDDRLNKFSEEQVDKTILIALKKIDRSQDEIREVIRTIMSQHR